MSKADTYLFVTQDEFNSICENRIDNIRQSLYNTMLLIREPSPDHRELSKTLDELLIKLSRVKLDMEDNARRNAQ